MYEIKFVFSCYSAVSVSSIVRPAKEPRRVEGKEENPESPFSAELVNDSNTSKNKNKKGILLLILSF